MVKNQIPTNQMEIELRKLYLVWLGGLSNHENDTADYISLFEKKSRALITKMGGHTAESGSALASFPVPKVLELSPRADVVYDAMQQAAIKASIAAGLNSTDAARQILHAGLGKSFNQLNRLARTETVSAYWKNAFDSVADLPDIVMIWGAENGPRTCDYCRSRDGLVIEDGNLRDHPNGRCTPIPTLLKNLKYIGTIDADGGVSFDPKYGKPTGKTTPLPDDSQPTEEQLDPLSSKRNPAAPSVAQAAQRSVAPTTNALNMTDAQKLQNAKIMFGSASPQYKAALKKWGPKR